MPSPVDESLTVCRLYQGFVAKSLTDKYNSLSSQMDSVINDANSEITGLREKMQCKLAKVWHGKAKAL